MLASQIEKIGTIAKTLPASVSRPTFVSPYKNILLGL